ncbi:MAG TPA: hypothetical protein VMM93_03660 [Vicinamibacterales bacterium]|nr:hypothetical protein [Vicinamibacterales bacterium]
MSIDVEYAIKKDIRNNPVVREIDLDQKREFLRTAVLAAGIVAMLLFSAWQHFAIVQHGYQVEDLRTLMAAEQTAQRKLRLELETVQRPQEIERRAIRELHLVAPTAADIMVIEQVRPASRPGAVMAEAR